MSRPRSAEDPNITNFQQEIIHVLHGMGGSGKTSELSISMGHRGVVAGVHVALRYLQARGYVTQKPMGTWSINEAHK